MLGGITIGSAPAANTKFLIQASSTSASDYSLRILQSDGITPLFLVRNDNKVSVGAWPSSTVLTVGGDIWTTGTVTAASFSGSITGTINAANVSSGTFASNTGFGNFTFGTSTNPILYIDNTNSRVGIGTTGPGNKLHIENSAGMTVKSGSVAALELIPGGSLNVLKWYGSNNFAISNDPTIGNVGNGAAGNQLVNITPAGNVGIGTSTPAYLLTVNGDVGANAYYYISDRRLKTNFRPISGLDAILQLQGVAFDWKANGKKGIGLIGQDVEKVFPELVSTDENTGLKSVEYGSLVAPLIESVKELHARLEKQERRITELENALSERGISP